MMRPIEKLGFLLLLLILPNLVYAQNNMDRVYEAVFEGDFVEKFWVFDHRWNFTSLVTLIVQADSTIEVKGKFRHYKKWNFDDRIRFHFKFLHGEVTKSEIEIKKEGFENYVTLGLADLLYSIFDDYSINTGTIDELIEQIALWPIESWTQAAQKIVVLIALEAYRPYMPPWSSPMSAPWPLPVASPPSAVRDFRVGGLEIAPVPPVAVYDCGVLMCQCSSEEDCEGVFE